MSKTLFLVIFILSNIVYPSDAFSLRIPIDRESLRGGRIIAEIGKPQIEVILSNLKIIKQKQWHEITKEEIQYLLLVMAGLNIDKEFFSGRDLLIGGALPIAADMLHKLVSAELHSLEYADSQHSISSSMMGNFNKVFIHEIGKITDYAHKMVLLLEGMKDEKGFQDIPELPHLRKTLDEYEIGYIAWRNIFKGLGKLKMLNPEIILALIDDFIAYNNEIVNFTSQVEEILNKYNDKVLEGISPSSLWLVSFIMLKEMRVSIVTGKEARFIGINESIERIAGLFNDDNVQIILEPDRNISDLELNPVLIYRLWFYLIDEARNKVKLRLEKAEIKNGSIIIKTMKLGDSIEVVFSDNGSYDPQEGRGGVIGTTIFFEMVNKYNMDFDVRTNSYGGADVVIRFLSDREEVNTNL